jgi:hypothetical protein
MGLDMYLEARKFVSSYSDTEAYQNLKQQMALTDGDLPHSNFGTLSLEVMYWRKVNAVHDWFVREVQNGEDDCKTYHVGRDKLAELLEICKRITDKQDDPSVADDLLPTASGFFFGGTDYDEYYYEGLLWTIEGIERILKNPAYEGMDFYYQASW